MVTDNAANSPQSITLTRTGAAGTIPTVTLKNPTGPGERRDGEQVRHRRGQGVADTVSIGTVRWNIGDFRVTGTSTTVGATVTGRSANNPALILGTAPVTAAVAPATGGAYSVRVRAGGAAVTKPGQDLHRHQPRRDSRSVHGHARLARAPDAIAYVRRNDPSVRHLAGHQCPSALDAFGGSLSRPGGAKRYSRDTVTFLTNAASKGVHRPS